MRISRQKRNDRVTAVSLVVAAMMCSGVPSIAATESGFSAAQERSDRQREAAGPSLHEQATSKATDHSLAGNRRILGRIVDIRGGQIQIDIGNLQPLSVPLKMSTDKGQSFKPGDPIVVTMSDHNAVVDYHHPNEASHHQVLQGRLKTPLTVGLDKAVVETDQGVKTFMIAEQAKGKLTAMPVGAELLFMTDETGRLVDAQLASAQAVQESAENNKARIKGAHEQVKAVFQGTGSEGKLKISQQGKEREVPFRPPLTKLDRLQPGQDVVLLMDEQGYVLEIATPDVTPTR